MEDFKVNFGGMYFDYDDKGRVIRIKEVNSHGVTCYTELEYDDQGRLLCVKKNDKRTSYEYDEQNRLICEHHTGDSAINNQRDIVVVKYEYTDTYIEKTIKNRLYQDVKRMDLNHRITSDTRTYKDGNTIKTEYQFNETTNIVTSESTIIKENGEIIHLGTTEYPMLPIMSKDECRKVYYPVEE